MSAPLKKCPQCEGTGMVFAENIPPHPPRYTRCGCVIHQDILAKTEKALPGLSKAPTVASSNLFGLEGTSAWITAGEGFLAHLRHIAIRKPLAWTFRVVSDADIVTAWLASIALKGQDILDADAYLVSTKYLTLPDIAMPPDLLVIRLGVKAARNQAAPEVLQEVLQMRSHEGKPTWLWDEPHNPLNPGHIFWSDSVGRTLATYQRVKNLETPKVTEKPKERVAAPVATVSNTKKTLRGGGS